MLIRRLAVALVFLTVPALAKTSYYPWLGPAVSVPDSFTPNGIRYNVNGLDATRPNRVNKGLNKLAAWGITDDRVSEFLAAPSVDWASAIDAHWRLTVSDWTACGYDTSRLAPPKIIILQPTLWTDSIPGAHDGECFPDGTIWVVPFYISATSADHPAYFAVDPLNPTTARRTLLDWEMANWVRIQLGLPSEGPCQ